MKAYKFWFCTGSQDLYGDECLRNVAEHSKIIVAELNKSGILPFEVVWKPTLITNELIRKTFNEANIDEECARYSAKIRESGGIDIQILGIGTNGHIGFNEPSDNFADGPFAVKLTQSTIDANSKYFEAVGDKMPEYALTMGIGDIMRAKRIILIATGKSKAEAIKKLVEGEVTPACPASILKLHADVTVFVDKDSASLLGDR